MWVPLLENSNSKDKFFSLRLLEKWLGNQHYKHNSGIISHIINTQIIFITILNTKNKYNNKW